MNMCVSVKPRKKKKMYLKKKKNNQQNNEIEPMNEIELCENKKNNQQTVSKTQLKPFLKWVGGKTQIIEQLFEKFPTQIRNYYEPFSGGGSVFIKLLEKMESGDIKVERLFISDINPCLIELYLCLKNKSVELINELETIKTLFNSVEEIEYPKRHKFNIPKNISQSDLKKKGKKGIYYYNRDRFNELLVKKKGGEIMSENEICKLSAYFIFLNKTSWRGVYREGPNGFNVPYGHYKNPNIYDKDYLLKLSKLFNDYNVDFKQANFNTIGDNVSQDDFVYLDPPYYPINKKSFVNYVDSGFNENDHLKLLELCQQINQKNAKFLQSNSSTDFIKEKYSDFNVEDIDCRRAINSKNPDSIATEVFIYN